jgi:hypothetical protein
MGVTTIVELIRWPLEHGSQSWFKYFVLVQLAGSIWAWRIIAARSAESSPIDSVFEESKSFAPIETEPNAENWLRRTKQSADKMTNDVVTQLVAWIRTRNGILTMAIALAVFIVIVWGQGQYEHFESERQVLERQIEADRLFVERGKKIAPQGDSDLSQVDQLLEWIDADLSESKRRFVLPIDVKRQVREYLERASLAGISIQELGAGDVRIHDFYKQYVFSLTLVASRDAIAKARQQLDKGSLLILWDAESQSGADQSGATQSDDPRIRFSVYSLDFGEPTESGAEAIRSCLDSASQTLWFPWLNAELGELRKESQAVCAEAMTNPLLVERLHQIDRLHLTDTYACEMVDQLIQAKYRQKVGTEISKEDYDRMRCEHAKRYGSMWFRIWRSIP